MTNPAVSSVKTLYICQTYVEQKAGSDSQTGFKIDKQFEYTTVSEAQNRAGRQTLRDDCDGADAYMVSEDPNSGEVGPPSFLVRLGDFPEIDDFRKLMPTSDQFHMLCLTLLPKQESPKPKYLPRRIRKDVFLNCDNRLQGNKF